MELKDQLGLLLGDFDHLKARVRHIELKTENCGDLIEVRCSYVAFRDGLPTFDEFVEVVSHHVTPFCLPRSYIRETIEKAKAGDHVQQGIAATTLSDRAKSLFIKAQKGSFRSGEGGEIVLYIFNEWLLHAPQIVSKMYLKTNHNMPVYGTDGIHARFDVPTKALHLYWGESKAHETLSSALSAALDSIVGFISDDGEKREIEIISNFLDVASWDDHARQALLEYLDPYSEASNERVSVYSCLLVFEHTYDVGEERAPATAEPTFVKEVSTAAAAFLDDIKAKLEGKGLGQRRFEFFLLPVPSVQGFRDRFQSKIGWPDD